MAWLMTRPVAAIGGFVLPRPQRVVPMGPGILIVMNHQSLFDVPLVIQTVADGYPRIVTRRRYTARFIPVISHMIRLYQYPVVDPTANRSTIKESLEELHEAARTTEVPLAVFPEGTRSKDGEIGRFKPGGLSSILSARPWTVYVFVVDGFWQMAKYSDFVRGTPRIHGTMEHVGVAEWTDPAADAEPFIRELREMMVEGLASIRERAAVA